MSLVGPEILGASGRGGAGQIGAGPSALSGYSGDHVRNLQTHWRKDVLPGSKPGGMATLVMSVPLPR